MSRSRKQKLTIAAGGIALAIGMGLASGGTAFAEYYGYPGFGDPQIVSSHDSNLNYDDGIFSEQICHRRIYINGEYRTINCNKKSYKDGPISITNTDFQGFDSGSIW